MDFIATLDSELAPALQALSAESGHNWQDIPGMRAGFNEMIATMIADLSDSLHVAKEDGTVPGLESAPQVPIRLYRPTSGSCCI